MAENPRKNAGNAKSMKKPLQRSKSACTSQPSMPVKQTLTSKMRLLKANPLLGVNKDDLLKLQQELEILRRNEEKANASKLDSTASFMKGKSLSSTRVDFDTKKNTKPIPKSTYNYNLNNAKVLPKPDVKPKPNPPARPKLLKTTSLDEKNSKKTPLLDKNVKTKGPNNKMVVRQKPQKLRRSLSAQHFDRKNKGAPSKGAQFIRPELCYSRKIGKADISISMENLLSTSKTITEIEEPFTFKTPKAYERRSLLRSTPLSSIKRHTFLPLSSTPRNSVSDDLQKRLNEWLTKRGKSVNSFHHLKCFGVHSSKINTLGVVSSDENNLGVVSCNLNATKGVNDEQKLDKNLIKERVDEENKENVEGVEIFDNGGSYEDLRIKTPIPLKTGLELEIIAKEALHDLHLLITENYSRNQCEAWLSLIQNKYPGLDKEPLYWECKASIEQARGNFSSAVECYKSAIIHGAEINSVDKSLDHLLEKFSLLDINNAQNNTEETNISRERARIIQDARYVFKSNIIQFAVQKKDLKKNKNAENKDTCKESSEINEKKSFFEVTPVRRSTRISRSNFVTTPKIQLVNSMQDIDDEVKENMHFHTNKALI